MRIWHNINGLRSCCAALALSLPLAVPVRAQLTAPVVPVQATPVPNGLTEFAGANPQCTEMTNGCEVCVRDASGKIECSTPGIACQPAAWQCKKGSGPADDSAKRAAPSR
ncbi:MAG: hypothetical protein ACKVP3_19565 [Hyphomicrobiaceae bacterium]